MRRAAFLGFGVVAMLSVSLVVSPEWVRAQATTTAPPQPTTRAEPAVVAEQVSFCDRTAAVVDPYSMVTAAVDSIVAQGHGGHTGPVFPAVGPDGAWGDIIPPFDYANGSQHFAGLNWPAGSAVLNGGCAVHETTSDVAVDTQVIVPNTLIAEKWFVCKYVGKPGDDERLQTGNNPLSVSATAIPDPEGDGVHVGDEFGDAQGRSVVIAQDVGQPEPPITDCPPPTGTTTSSSSTSTTTTTARPTTTIDTSTSTTMIRPIRPPGEPVRTTTTTTTGGPVRSTTTTSPPGEPVRTTTTTPGLVTAPDQTTTTSLAPGGSTTSVAGVATTTTTPRTAGSGSTSTTTTVPSPTGTTPPTAAPFPLDPPPVEALAPGEALSDPLPRVIAFVIAPGNNTVVLGELSPDQVRAVYRELAERRLAHTGSQTGPLSLVALLSLMGGGVLLGLAARRRRGTA
jgi:hypothetical protein